MVKRPCKKDLCLIDNLSERLHEDKCIDRKFCLDYMMFKDDQLIFGCLECKKDYEKDFNKDIIRRFTIISESCNKILINLFCY